MKLSSRSDRVTVSGIRKVFELAASIEDPIDLSIGQPDFSVPEVGRQAAHKAIDEGFTRYTLTQGIGELRQKVKDYYKNLHGVEFEQSIVTSGVAGAVLLAFFSLLEEGDEILIPDPAFMLYEQWANFLGAKTVRYNTYPDFRAYPERIEAAITDRTKLLIVLSPSNPTGAVLPDSDIRKIAEIAKKHDLLVLSDEIYDRFTYDSEPTSICRYYDNVLCMGGYSKFAGMPGMRLGYALGKEELIGCMRKLQQFSFVCAPSVSQKIGVAMLDADFTPTLERYRRKRDIIYDGLKDNFDVEKPGGAFYIFPKAPWGTGTEFAEYAIKNKVLIIPGGQFSAQDTHFRLSFAADDATLHKGIDVLNRLAKEPPAKT
ncbi:MAG: aminotransferase class I/II-fold pyridoxal phosphate-dependent enzyme [Planctomycetota bacterium]|nr:aminotransferase class I/II-fold pyridoxal phosphate-dependent enzyme [Planctomycetota bacterium]